MPNRPPTARERFGGGRKAADAAYNAARAHRPDEKIIHSRRWQAVRLLALRRDGYLCVKCRAEGFIERARDVDHVKPRDTHPELAFDPDNLMSLCRAHHNAKTRAGA